MSRHFGRCVNIFYEGNSGFFMKTKPISCIFDFFLITLCCQLTMANEALKFLEAHQSEAPSRFTENAQWRKENAGWLRWSRQVALAIIDYMQENGMKRADLAKKLGVSPQYVSRLLSGTENLSFKSIANIEEKLGVNCLDAVLN